MTLKWDSTLYRYEIFNISMLLELFSNGLHKNNLFVPNFCNVLLPLPLPKHISKDRSPFSIISLFDGSGSFTDVIAKALGAWPKRHSGCGK